jgi:hypothetical protein
MPKPTAVVFPGFISLQKMGAHETLFNHKINSEWNGKEPTILMRLCNHHKLNTYGTERNGADCN